MSALSVTRDPGKELEIRIAREHIAKAIREVELAEERLVEAERNSKGTVARLGRVVTWLQRESRIVLDLLQYGE